MCIHVKEICSKINESCQSQSNIVRFLTTLPTLQSLTGPEQGQNRVFPVEYFHTGKILFSLAGIPVMKTGLSLMEILYRETPVFITGIGLQ